MIDAFEAQRQFVLVAVDLDRLIFEELRNEKRAERFAVFGANSST